MAGSAQLCIEKLCLIPIPQTAKYTGFIMSKNSLQIKNVGTRNFKTLWVLLDVKCKAIYFG